MCKALAEGATDPAAIAALADCRLRATPEQLQDALGASQHLNGVYRRLLKMALEELNLIEDQMAHIEDQMAHLEQEAADLLRAHRDAIVRMAEIPGVGPDSAYQIIAEIGGRDDHH